MFLIYSISHVEAPFPYDLVILNRIWILIWWKIEIHHCHSIHGNEMMKAQGTALYKGHFQKYTPRNTSKRITINTGSTGLLLEDLLTWRNKQVRSKKCSRKNEINQHLRASFGDHNCISFEILFKVTDKMRHQPTRYKPNVDPEPILVNTGQWQSYLHVISKITERIVHNS